MAEITAQNLSIDGITPSFSSANAGGDSFANNGKTLLYVKNGGASSITVTIASQVTNAPAGTIAQDKTVTIAAGSEKIIGPFPQNGYNDANGQVQVSYSDVTSVTVAVLKLIE